MQNKVLSFLGLASKAGKVVSGEFAAEKAIKGGNAFFVIIASDASENTKKHFSDTCNFRKVPYTEYATMEELGRCIGKVSRASIALTDEGLGNALKSKIKEEDK